MTIKTSFPEAENNMVNTPEIVESGCLTDFSIINATLVTPDKLIERGSVRIEAGTITEISSHIVKSGRYSTVDAGGRLLLPGFIDLHADSLETAIAPRPAAPFEPSAVLPSYDAELAMHGITTVFHCVGLAETGDIGKSLRTREMAKKIIRAIRAFTPQALLRTKIHLRYEITDTGSLPLIDHLVEAGMIDLVSIMDHTPGFGVFKDIEAYRDYYRRSGQTVEAADERFAALIERREGVDEAALEKLVKTCLTNGLTVVSHDDHTAEKLQWALDLGVSVAEFPVTLEAVDYARSHEMMTVFGAPNLVRGVSHAGNLRVADMIASNRADILCLDYSPMCSLPALFKTAEVSRSSLAEASRLFSANPAASIGLDALTGTLEVGKQADLILVDTGGSIPRVLATYVGGRPVYQSLSAG